VNNSRLYIAAAILIGLVVAVVATRRSRESVSSLEKPSATLTELKKPDVTQLSIQKPGQPAVVLVKQGDVWALSAPLAAEANQDAVSAALDKLAELKVAGVAATRKENQEKLEVDAAHGIHVIARAGDKPLIDLYVGRTTGTDTVVREEGKDASLTAKGSFRYVFDKELKDFRKREISELDVAQLSALSVTSPKGSFKFERTAGATPEAPGVWAQAKGEKPIAKLDPEQVQALASTAAHLRASDFASASDGDAVTGLSSPVAKLTLTKKDSTSVELALGKQHAGSEDYYVRVGGSEVVYRLAKYSAEKLMPDSKSFEKVEKPAQAAAPEGMPPGMQMMGGGGPGGQQISPEMMQQIQRQLAAQGQAHP
jgi:hypothetical protein